MPPVSGVNNSSAGQSLVDGVDECGESARSVILDMSSQLLNTSERLVLAAPPAEQLDMSQDLLLTQDLLLIVNSFEVELHGIQIITHHLPLTSETNDPLQLLRVPDQFLCVSGSGLVVSLHVLEHFGPGVEQLRTAGALEGLGLVFS